MRKTIVSTLFFLSVLIALYFYRDLIDIALLKSFLAAKRRASYFLYVAMQVLQGVSIIVPLSPMTIAGAAVFGTKTGMALSWIGVLISQAVAFLIARGAAQEYVRKAIDKPKYAFIKRVYEISSWNRNSYLSIFLLYASGVMSFDVLAYGLGLTKIRFSAMMLVVAIGICPKLLLLNYVGGALTAGTGAAIGSLLLAIVIAFAVVQSRRGTDKYRE